LTRFLLGSVFLILLLQTVPVSAESSIVFSEIMYHPPDPDEALEYIELHNPEPPRVDLSGWRIEGEVECTFPHGTEVLPGQFLVIARAPALLQKARSLNVMPIAFAGKLANGGGRLRLLNNMGVVACRVTYGDRHPFPVSPDGTGHSLSLIDPLLDPSAPESWAPSPTNTGTPGRSNGLTKGYGKRLPPAGPALRINEVRVGEDPFVEIFNASESPVDLKGIYITDEFSDLKRYVFPGGMVLKPFGFLALPKELFDPAFALPAGTLEIALTAPEGNRVLDAVRVRIPKDSPVRGRFPDGSGVFVELTEPSPGGANTVPPTPDLVITEIMYHPISEDDEDEYIEIFNRSKHVVDLTGFKVSRGVRFTFPKKAKITPRGFVVLAKNPSRVSGMHKVARATVFGPYKGVLSNAGETVRLEDSKGRLVDAVCYGDGRPWPERADGLGASLELINPGLENDLPSAWGASRDSDEAKWTTFTYGGAHRKVRGQNVSEFQFLLLDEGECLIDRVQLVTSEERLVAESFERGDSGWSAVGTHDRSSIIPDPDNPKRHCYRLVAEGGGDPRNNYVSVKVRRDMKEGKIYYLRFRARWCGGSKQLLTRSVGQGVAQVHTLSPSPRLGTPGSPNSILRFDTGPIIAEPEFTPLCPQAGKRARVLVRIDGPAVKARVWGRRNGTAEWKSLPLEMTHTPAIPGSSIWKGSLPPMGAGIIEYFVEAEDIGGHTGTYPPAAPDRTALLLVGLQCHEKLPTLHLLIADRNWRALAGRPRTSNKYTSAALVYGDSFIFQDVDFRRRGSPYHRPQDINRNVDWKVVFGAKTLGGRRCLSIDRKSEGRNQNERTVHWLLTKVRVPSSRARYIHFNIAGHQEGLCEDVERVDGGFVKKWFPGKGRGNLHKIDAYWEIGEGRKAVAIAGFFRYLGESPELYRWNFPPRASGAVEDFKPLIRLIALMDPKVTTSKFPHIVENHVDVDQWLRAFSVRTIADDWDTIGRRGGKTAYIYKPSGTDSLWNLLVWDSDLTFRNSQSALFSDRFPSFKRLLDLPHYRRQFWSYLGYLSRGPLRTPQLEPVVRDNAAVSGFPPDRILAFAAQRCDFVVSQMPPGPGFSIRSVKRIPQRDSHDLLRVKGTAPTLASRFTLLGRPGTYRILDQNVFVAEIPVGPESGKFQICAEDFGGNLIQSRSVRIPGRSAAKPLEELKLPNPPQRMTAPQPPRQTFILNMGDKPKPVPPPAKPADTPKTAEPAKPADAPKPPNTPKPPPTESPPVENPKVPEPETLEPIESTENLPEVEPLPRPTGTGPTPVEHIDPSPRVNRTETRTEPESGWDDSAADWGPPMETEEPAEKKSSSTGAKIAFIFLVALFFVLVGAILMQVRISREKRKAAPAPVPSSLPVVPPPSKMAFGGPAPGRSGTAQTPLSAGPGTFHSTPTPPHGVSTAPSPPPVETEKPAPAGPSPLSDLKTFQSAPTPPEGINLAKTPARGIKVPPLEGEPLEPEAEMLFVADAQTEETGKAGPEAPPPIPPAAGAPTPSLEGIAADIEELTNPIFEIASGAFFRLRSAGLSALPELLRAEGRDATTPFGRIGEGPKGFHPEPVAEGMPPLPLRDVVRFLAISVGNAP
jgi:hypothetical protein